MGERGEKSGERRREGEEEEKKNESWGREKTGERAIKTRKEGIKG